MRINTDKDCNIIIYDDTEYPVNGLEYSESSSLYIAQLNQSNISTILYNRLDLHTNSTGEPIILSPQTGGFITMCHIIFPKVDNLDDFDPIRYIRKYVETKDFIRNFQIDNLFELESSEEENSEEEYFDIPGGYCVCNGEIYYKDIQGNTRVVNISEILEINPDNFGLIKQVQNFFSVCYLRKCYISLCKKIFNGSGFNRCFDNKVSSQLIYKRDLVWSALNVIQYMIDSNQLAEAQRLLERIMGCNGICSGEKTGEDCGCE